MAAKKIVERRTGAAVGQDRRIDFGLLLHILDRKMSEPSPVVAIV